MSEHTKKHAPSQQESSATTAMQPEYKHCSVCLVPWTPKDLTDRGLCPECVSDEAWDARDTADHPNPAPPEPELCDDDLSIPDLLLSLGVPPVRYLTPEEREVDQEEWRERVRMSIAETQKGKVEK